MRSAVDDVQHRHRQLVCIHPAEVTVQGHSRVGRGGFRHRERYTENGVGAQLTLRRRPVQGNHFGIDFRLAHRVHAHKLRSKHAMHVCDRFADALPQIAAFVPVPKFNRLALTR